LWRGRIPEVGELDAVSPDWRARWDPARWPRRPIAELRHAMEKFHDRELEGQLAVVRELAAAGAPVLAGTDTPNPYVVPGASLHQELALLAAAGLTPYAALRAATIDAADFLGDPHDGRIAPGARADLVVLDGDPLADLRALDRIDGVVVRGHWLSGDELRTRHDELVAAYRAPAWLAPVELPDAHVVRYVVADNGTAVGAYGMARRAGEVVERQTLEDETISARTATAPDGTRTLALDVERPDGTRHAEHAGRTPRLVAWLSPATAASLVESAGFAAARSDARHRGGPIEPAVLEPDERVALAVAEPERDAPDTLHRGELSIRRQPDGDHGEHVYRLHLTVDHGSWMARLVIDLDGIPRELRVTDSTRPVVRTWKRER
ncbi:MAG TPA: amidohydrolase family protein, partial [Kofleriaceae bacterium]|nr:amidohydrolase family protein [Kofleriaceae bacterium]